MQVSACLAKNHEVKEGTSFSGCEASKKPSKNVNLNSPMWLIEISNESSEVSYHKTPTANMIFFPFKVLHLRSILVYRSLMNDVRLVSFLNFYLWVDRGNEIR